MKSSNRFLFCLYFFIWLGSTDPGIIQAQHHHRDRSHTIIAIEKAYEAGELTPDRQLLYKFYAAVDPSKLPAPYRPEQPEPVKCGTPLMAEYLHLRDRLQPSTVTEIENMISQTRSRPDETFTSASGIFQIHFDRSGEDAVPSTDTMGINGIPDYVEFVAAAADSSMRYQVRQLGFTDPIKSSGKYDIIISDLGPGFFGLTRSLGNTTEIEIHNNFLNGFPPNTHPDGDQIGAINVTMAHEFKHAIQFANNEWRGSAGSFGWIEMDATLMEELTYDNVNDYYNVIHLNDSIFSNPAIPIPGGFWNVTWALFFAEFFGSPFWVDVWAEIKVNPTMDFLKAIQNQVELQGRTFPQLFAENHLWHLASGSNFSLPDFGFEERRNYPNSTITASINGIQDSLDRSISVNPLAARYFHIVPQGNEPDQVLITLASDRKQFAAGAVATFRDGSSATFFGISPSSSGTLTLQTPWNWDDIEEIGVVAVNTGQSERMRLNIGTGSHGAGPVTLAQNYPNPFDEQTVIEFVLPEDSNVQLEIYDVTGRLVKTIMEGRRPAGSYSPVLERGRLASGVYFYRLATDERTLTKKMTVIH